MVKKIIETFDLRQVFRLKKRKKVIVALDKINIDVHEGEILGILGPNGAGKTTLIKDLCCLQTPTDGYAIVNGYNILKDKKDVKNSISLMLGSWMVYFHVTGRDNLNFFAKIYGIEDYEKKIKELGEEFEFSLWLDEYTDYYSSGMRMKLCLIRSLLIDRPIFYMDEPTTGLDPKATQYIVQKIMSLKDRNKTILLTTHRMNVANAVCDRIVLLKEGNVLKVDKTENLKKLILERLIIDISIEENMSQLIKDLKSNNFVEEITPTDNGFRVYVKDNSYYPQIFEIVKNYKILNFREYEPSLNEVFTTLL